MREVLFLTSALIVGCLGSTTGQAESIKILSKWDCLATSSYHLIINPANGHYNVDARTLNVAITITYENVKLSEGLGGIEGSRLMFDTKKEEETLPGGLDNPILRFITIKTNKESKISSSYEMGPSDLNVTQGRWLKKIEDNLDVIYRSSWNQGEQVHHLEIREDDKDWKFIVTDIVGIFTEKWIREAEITTGLKLSSPSGTTRTIIGKCIKTKD
jgi:hypothetical protein